MLLYVEAAALTALSITLAVPVPLALARAAWPARSPRAALVLWQAVGLGGGLGILTAGLTLAAARIGSGWYPGLLAVPDSVPALGVWGWLGLGLTALMGLWLVGSAIGSTVRVLRARRAHRWRLAMISGALGEDTGGRFAGDIDVRLVDHSHAVAYCLPGFRPQVVLTRGVLESLRDVEIAAVLAHERAHARGRHDLVLQPFVAWAATFPFLPSARVAVGAVGELVEMLADDVARRTVGDAALAGALDRLGAQYFAVTGTDGSAAGSELRTSLRSRLVRLSERSAALRPPATAAVYGAAALLVLAPPLILLAS